MSTYLYDEGLVEKFKRWTSKTETQVYGPSEVRRLFEVIADNKNDSDIKLPLITLSRDRGYDIINDGTTRRPLSYDGITLSHNEEKKTSRILNAIPISLVYQIDVYARLAIEADILMRNLVFNIINYPAFEVDIPDAGFCHTARIEFASNTIDDNSNEPESFIEGNFTKLSAKISIEDAYLWDVRQHRDAEIEIKIDDTYENRNYRCLDCGYLYQGYNVPEACPICGKSNWRKEINPINSN